MSECLNAELRDLLPDLVTERLNAADRARVAAHVVTCEACTAEVELLRAAQRVMTRDVPTVNVARIVAALPKPPAADSRPVLVASSTRAFGGRSAASRDAARSVPARRYLHQWSGWRVAAAATIAVGGLSVAVIRSVGPGSVAHPEAAPIHASGPTSVAPAPVGPTAVTPAPDVPVATPSQSEPAQSAPTGSPSGPVAEGGSGLTMSGDISELSDGDVETLLQDLDGLDAQPSADPDAASPALRGVDSP